MRVVLRGSRISDTHLPLLDRTPLKLGCRRDGPLAPVGDGVVAEGDGGGGGWPSEMFVHVVVVVMIPVGCCCSFGSSGLKELFGWSFASILPELVFGTTWD